MKDEIQQMYKGLCLKHGISASAVKARDYTQQELRFVNLFYCIDVQTTDSFLDLGCGTGELLPFIRKHGVEGEYVGLDFVDEFIFHARDKFKNDEKSGFKTFNISEDELPTSYDWCVLSGTFNDERVNSEEFMYSVLSKMYRSSNKGIIFNSLSKYVDYETPELFYTYPDKVFQFCVNNLSKFIVLRTDYQLRENTIPFEYSMAVRKKLRVEK